jgi:class 3 adenylate cyclase
MPIYMDRHFIEGATRHSIENAHARDLQVQAKYGAKFLTYWFDEARHTAFCLVEASDKVAIQKTHAEAHGMVPHEIIEVDPAVVAAFLGRVQDPVPADAAGQAVNDSAFRAIMFTDLKDSTLTTTRLGEARALHLLHIHNALTRTVLREFDGREVKHLGDGIMATFPSIPNAVAAARAIQRAFADHNQQHPEEALQLRLGLSAGEPVEEGGDFFGSAVNLAARLCAHAQPGQIVAAEIVRDEAAAHTEEFIDLGEITPKGFDHPQHVYEVRWQEG